MAEKEDRRLGAMIVLNIKESGSVDFGQEVGFVPGFIKGVKFNSEHGTHFDSLSEGRKSVHKGIDTLFDLVKNGLETGKDLETLLEEEK